MQTVVGRQGSGLDKLRSVGVSAEVEGRQGANQGKLIVCQCILRSELTMMVLACSYLPWYTRKPRERERNGC